MHGVGRPDVPLSEALLPPGFVGSLRPFSGLREENFRQVMAAIISLRPHLARTVVWDRELVEGLRGLTTTARQWGLDPNGMLQRNRLVSAEDSVRLLQWVVCLESAVSRLMRGGDPADALAYYRGESADE